MTAGSEVRRALIIEDLIETQRWLQGVINEAFPGVRTEVAASVADARRWLAEDVFDLLLVDLGLPDGSGLEVLATASELEPIPACVVTTIFDDDRNLFAALRAGARGYLLKERPASELAAALRGILDGQPPLSPAVARRLLSFFAPAPEPTVQLSPRESDVLTFIAKGCTVAEAARILELSANTVAGYVKEIYRKLRVNNRAEAVLEAARRGMV